MSESQIMAVEADWNGQSLSHGKDALAEALERGRVLYFQHLGFDLSESERRLLDPKLADPKRKNISLSEHKLLLGVAGDAEQSRAVGAMIERFQARARGLVDALVPAYRSQLRTQPTSLRLHRVETRQSSWRADDSRLHVDAFPSRPNRGERILRVFANIHPASTPRVWRVGEPFEAVARRFLPTLPRQWPGSAALLAALKITKSYRTPYDHLMLALHDAMKADLQYQRDCKQETIGFVPGSVWICFSDQTSHAVMSGQFMLEQTFFLPPGAMVDPSQSPLRILERLSGRTLVS